MRARAPPLRLDSRRSRAICDARSPQRGVPMSRIAPPEGMLCPACRVDLVMSDRQGVEIDYCPRCRGVWLDRGELDKIIERSDRDDDRDRDRQRGGGGGGDQYRDDRRPYGGDYQGKPYKKKSFWHELFD